MIARILTAIGTYLATLVGGSAKDLATKGAIFLAQKALIIGLFYVALPLILYNVIVGMIFDFIEFALNYVSECGISDLAIQFTGMGGWMAQQIMLPQAFSIFMSFLAIRFIMRFIPFMK